MRYTSTEHFRKYSISKFTTKAKHLSILKLCPINLLICRDDPPPSQEKTLALQQALKTWNFSWYRDPITNPIQSNPDPQEDLEGRFHLENSWAGDHDWFLSSGSWRAGWGRPRVRDTHYGRQRKQKQMILVESLVLRIVNALMLIRIPDPTFHF